VSGTFTLVAAAFSALCLRRLDHLDHLDRRYRRSTPAAGAAFAPRHGGGKEKQRASRRFTREGLRPVLLLLFAFVLGAPPPAGAEGAAVAQTTGGWVSGAVQVSGGALEVGGEPVAWDALRLLLPASPMATLPAPHAIRTRTGETWACTIRSAGEGRVVFQTPRWGEHTLPLANVAALDFTPGLAPPRSGSERMTLHRRAGEAITGRLVAFDGRRIRIETPLGTLAFSHGEAERYVLRPPLRRPPEADTLALAGGSVLRGRLEPAGEGFRLEHAHFGPLELAAAWVAWIRRKPPEGVVDLEAGPGPDEASAAEVSGDGLLSGRVWADQVGSCEVGSYEVGEAGRFLRGRLLRPHARVSYRLPPEAGRFFATLLPAPGAASSTRVRITRGGETLLQKSVAPGDAPIHVALEVGGDPTSGGGGGHGEERSALVIEADFAGDWRQPQGIILGDPAWVEAVH